MPTIDNFGISVGLQMAAALDDAEDDAFVSVPESHSTCVWKESDGLIHPVYVTTVQTPAKIMAEHGIPVKMVVDFQDPSKLPDYMRGDIRVELLLDGVESGLKYYREFKIKGKGFHLEFAGYRVGRTEERPFVFNPLPQMAFSQELHNVIRRREKIELHNYALGWVQEMHTQGNSEPTQMTDEVYLHRAVYPSTPVGLPPGVSEMQLLVTVGKKYRTLEKYFMAGAKQTTAFYYAPRPPVNLSLDPGLWQSHVNSNTPKRNSGAATSAGKRTTGGLARLTISRGQPSQDGISNDNSQTAGIQGELSLDASSKGSMWRPVGLAGKVRKTVQSKEVEFAARIHLVRVSFFIGMDLRSLFMFLFLFPFRF
jgi:hypothetical protein